MTEQLTKSQILLLASSHPYDCRCDICLQWWVLMGPEDKGDGEWSTGPFTIAEYRAAGGTVPSDVVCYVCGKAIDISTDYHRDHEEDCPNATYYDNEDQPWYDYCTCDLNKCVDCVEKEEANVVTLEEVAETHPPFCTCSVCVEVYHNEGKCDICGDPADGVDEDQVALCPVCREMEMILRPV